MKSILYNLGLFVCLWGCAGVAIAGHGGGGHGGGGGGGHHGGGGMGGGGGHHGGGMGGGGGHHMSAPSHHFSSPSASHHFSSPAMNMHHSPAGNFSGNSGASIQHHHSAGSIGASQIHSSRNHSSGSAIANQIHNANLHHGGNSNIANHTSASHFHSPNFTNQHFNHHPGGAGNSGNYANHGHHGNNGNWSGHSGSHYHPNYRNNSSFFFGVGSPFGSYYGSRFGIGFGGVGYGYGNGFGYGYGPYSNFGYGSGFGYGGYGGGYGRSGFGYGGYGYSPSYSTSGYGYSAPTTYIAGTSGSVPASGIIDISSVPAGSGTVVQSPASASNNNDNASALDYAGRGEQDFKSANYKQAAKNWRHALVEDPNNAAYVLLLGQALFASGEFDEAAGATQQAARALPPENWELVVKNYRQLYGNIGDYTTQLRALEKARTEKPDAPALRFMLGWHYGYLGFPKEAVAELDKLLVLAPTDEIGKKLRDQFVAKLPKTETATPPAPTKEAGEAKIEVEKKDV